MCHRYIHSPPAASTSSAEGLLRRDQGVCWRSLCNGLKNLKKPTRNNKQHLQTTAKSSSETLPWILTCMIFTMLLSLQLPSQQTELLTCSCHERSTFTCQILFQSKITYLAAIAAKLPKMSVGSHLGWRVSFEMLEDPLSESVGC